MRGEEETRPHTHCLLLAWEHRTSPLAHWLPHCYYGCPSRISDLKSRMRGMGTPVLSPQCDSPVFSADNQGRPRCLGSLFWLLTVRLEAWISSTSSRLASLLQYTKTSLTRIINFNKCNGCCNIAIQLNNR